MARWPFGKGPRLRVRCPASAGTGWFLGRGAGGGGCGLCPWGGPGWRPHRRLRVGAGPLAACGAPSVLGRIRGITGSCHTRRQTLYLTQLLANTPPVTSHLLGAEAGLGCTEGPGRLCGGPLHACGCPPGELCPWSLHRRQTTWDLSRPLTPLRTQSHRTSGGRWPLRGWTRGEWSRIEPGRESRREKKRREKERREGGHLRAGPSHHPGSPSPPCTAGVRPLAFRLGPVMEAHAACQSRAPPRRCVRPHPLLSDSVAKIPVTK